MHDLPSRDCPRCHGHNTMAGRAKPDAVHVVQWRCHNCGHALTTQGSDTYQSQDPADLPGA